MASGEVDDTLLEALEDYVKRQRKQPIGAKARGVFPSRRARRSCRSTKARLPLDAGLLAAAQAVEHYEISRYGTLATWADELGMAEA